MKKYKSFFAGMLVMISVLALSGTALAASGQLQISDAGLVISDVVKVKPGDTYPVDGQRLPAAVSYTGTDGKPYYYLPAQMMSDYFNVQVGWNEKQGSIVLGASSNDKTSLESKDPNPTKPKIGVKIGPYKEIASSGVDMKQQPSLICDDKTHVQTVTSVHLGDVFIPANGKYVIFRVTNKGKERVTCLAGQPVMLGEPTYFPAVDLEPGRTLTRAFELDSNTSEENAGLLFDIRGAAGTSEPIDVEYSLMQFK